MVWPGGIGTPLHLVGRARDLVTPSTGEPIVVAKAEMLVTVGAERTLESIETTPQRRGIEKLVGVRGGSYLRSAIDEALPGEREASPRRLSLSLRRHRRHQSHRRVRGSRWQPDLAAGWRGAHRNFGCARRWSLLGLRPGGWAQTARNRKSRGTHAAGGVISEPKDPGLARLPRAAARCMRRHRRGCSPTATPSPRRRAPR
jgi:hypothetical protein